mgnify:CR=1 FL=1
MSEGEDRSFGQAPLTLQQLVGAAERLGRREAAGIDPGEWLGVVEGTWDRLRQRPFLALPMRGFRTEEGGKSRLIASSEPGDRLVEESILPLVQKAVEPGLHAGVHAYRAGRSTFTAAHAVSRALAAGNTAVAMLDVADFFPSIDRDILLARLSCLLPSAILELIRALVSAPIRVEGALLSTHRGLPLGRAISPVLANAYLMDLDERASKIVGVYTRYGDDICLACPTAANREHAESEVRDSLSALGLSLAAHKTRRIDYEGQPIQYLGHTVDGKGIYERVRERRLDRILSGRAPVESAPEVGVDRLLPSPRHQTLYVTRMGVYLSVEKGQIRVSQAMQTLREVPLHRVDRVLVLSGVRMSSGFVSACVSRQIPVLFFVGHGKAYGSLVAGGMPNPLRLRAQYQLHSDAPRRLAMARAIVDAKLTAMARRLANVTEAAEARGGIASCRDMLPGCSGIAALDGIEGAGTKAYYAGFATRIRVEGFQFERRLKRPPRDPINSLLSFAYSLLFAEMQTALLAHGLDPYPGLLHELRDNHPALASDLVEPYRYLIGDSFVLTLVNNHRVAPGGFVRHANGGVFMSDQTRHVVLMAYEAFMEAPLGGARRTGTARDLIDGAARAMLKVVLGVADSLCLPLAARDAEPMEDDSERVSV